MEQIAEATGVQRHRQDTKVRQEDTAHEHRQRRSTVAEAQGLVKLHVELQEGWDGDLVEVVVDGKPAYE